MTSILTSLGLLRLLLLSPSHHHISSSNVYLSPGPLFHVTSHSVDPRFLGSLSTCPLLLTFSLFISSFQASRSPLASPDATCVDPLRPVCECLSWMVTSPGCIKPQVEYCQEHAAVDIAVSAVPIVPPLGSLLSILFASPPSLYQIGKGR